MTFCFRVRRGRGEVLGGGDEEVSLEGSIIGRVASGSSGDGGSSNSARGLATGVEVGRWAS